MLWDVDPVREYAAVNGAKGEGGSLDGPGAVVVRGIVFVNSGRHAWERAAGVRTERTRSAANVRHSALRAWINSDPQISNPDVALCVSASTASGHVATSSTNGPLSGVPFNQRERSSLAADGLVSEARKQRKSTSAEARRIFQHV